MTDQVRHEIRINDELKSSHPYPISWCHAVVAEVNDPNNKGKKLKVWVKDGPDVVSEEEVVL